MLRNRKRFYYSKDDNKTERRFENYLGPSDPRVAVKVKKVPKLIRYLSFICLGRFFFVCCV